MSKSINFNGTVVDASQPVLTHRNRAFRYGDALFETIRLMNGEILYFEKHLERLKRSMELLGMEWHEDFSFQNLHLLIRHLEQVNELKGNGRIRFEVFREDSGLYAPESNHVSYLIEAEKMEETQYHLNETGLRIEFFKEVTKPVSKLSNLKTSNALTYVLAGINKKNSGCGDCIIFNSEGNVAEAISSNIFIVTKNEVFTPSLDQACIAGVMREVIIDILRTDKKFASANPSFGGKVIEKKIAANDLLLADEIFLTNVIDGITWVGAIKSKRYFNKFSKALMQAVKEQLKL